MTETPIPTDVLDVLDVVEHALTRAATVAITLGPSLGEPYPDDPRWTPNTRFLEPMGKQALTAMRVLREARANAR